MTIITLGGKPGSGKSTIAKILVRKLDYKHYSTGGYMREMAEEKQLTLLELSKIAEEDRSIDEELDQWQINLGKNEDDFIIDAHLGFHFIPDSIKVFLNADFEERAKRILADTIRKENDVSIETTKENIKIREASEKKRYKEYYDIDPYDESKYDLVVDTTNLTPEQIVNKILKFIDNK